MCNLFFFIRNVLMGLSFALLMACTANMPEEQTGSVDKPDFNIALTEQIINQQGKKQLPVTEDEVVVEPSPARISKHKELKQSVARPAIAPAKMMANVQALSSVRSEMGYSADLRMPSEPLDRENYKHFDDNPLKLLEEQSVSTFSIDVDTGAYSNVRRFLNEGRLPNKDAVRVEELINYFAYDYPVPKTKKQPFSVTTEIAPTPWNEKTKLLHVGIKGYELPKNKIPASNLVFLIDVSGSMRAPNKLGLLKSSLKLLTQQMSKKDRVSIVVYAGASGVVLEPTAGNQSSKISMALDQLSAGGSTNGGAGIRLAYSLAEQSFIEGGVNRVILATDGDFNVGTVNFESLKQLIEEKRKTGIALTTLGFGTGNYNDHLMEQLADAGNGNYAYIDTLNEARKVLVDELTATLLTIAQDVKIQIEFNPALVSEYRLIGYENRILNREDFNNDKVDAGDIGAGHSVTALYEIALNGDGGEQVSPLRYQDKPKSVENKAEEIAFLRLRYKLPGNDKSTLIEHPLLKHSVLKKLSQSSDCFRFAAAVAAFGQQLRNGKFLNDFSYDEIVQLARKSKGDDYFGYRGEFLQIVGLADALSAKKLAQQ